MNRRLAKGVSLLVISLGLACNALASPQHIRNVNVCRGPGNTCYCAGACEAGPDGCSCL